MCPEHHYCCGAACTVAVCAHCQPLYTLQNNREDDAQPRHKPHQQDSPNRRKKERKRERSVDEALDGEMKRQRSDRRSSNGRVAAQDEDEVELVEIEREEKKRSSRRRKET